MVVVDGDAEAGGEDFGESEGPFGESEVEHVTNMSWSSAIAVSRTAAARMICRAAGEALGRTGGGGGSTP